MLQSQREHLAALRAVGLPDTLFLGNTHDERFYSVAPDDSAVFLEDFGRPAVIVRGSLDSSLHRLAPPPTLDTVADEGG